MKIKSILIILLLMSFSLIFASEDPTEAEHWEKVRQLDQLAEKFKAETGFRGTIQTSTERMCLGYYEGKFADIQITADADTASFRVAFDRILDKVLPYTFAKREQLTSSKITNNLGVIETVYCQQVNGYLVEGAGKVFIAYETGRNGFDIGNGTVELPSKTPSTIISFERAVHIAKDYYVKKLGYPKDTLVNPATNTIAYASINSKYELCYILGIADPNPKQFNDLTIVINATTGEVRDVWNLMSPLYGCVSGKIYATTTTDYNIPTTAPMDSVEVQNVNNYYYSDLNGNCTIANLPPNNVSSRIKLRDKYFLTIHPSETDIVTADSIITNADGSVSIKYNADNANSANVYYHATKQYIGLNALSEYTPSNLRITTEVDTSSVDSYGAYSFSANRILIREDKSKYSHVIRHELSHAFTFSKLSNHYFRDGNSVEDYAAMDESFAHYFPCSVSESPNAVTGLTSGQALYENISNIITALQVKNLFYSFFTLDERMYSYYYSAYPIASAWWSLRGNQYFPSDIQGINGVDTLLVNSLRRVKYEIPDNKDYRYKPRYFYNILMSRVDTDGSSWPLNIKQLAINKAYNDRGFHFYPTVESIAGSSTPIAQSFYNPGDSVYVHIKDCPQNTIVGIRVVTDVDTYTQIGADGIAIPAAVNIGGNSVFREVKTNENGEWKGSIYFSNQLSPGDYDIIVDVGSPTTPDNRLNLVFAKDNVIDAVDGLDGAGFTVTNLGDAVVALDLSSSMDGYGLQQTARIPTIPRK